MTLGTVLVLALGGESVGGESTAIAVVALASIVGGYLLLAGLWYFVFRDRHRKPPHNDQRQEPAPGERRPVRPRLGIKRAPGTRVRRRRPQ